MMTTMVTTMMTATMVNTLNVYSFRPNVGYSGGCVLVAAYNEKYAKVALDRYLFDNMERYEWDGLHSSKDFLEPETVEGVTYNGQTEGVILWRVYVE